MEMRILSSLMLLTIIASPIIGQETFSQPTENEPLKVFEQRIMPIFKSPKPASCIQCHLSAVDLKDYILPSHEQTFVSLRDQGLIDLDQPEKSKILTLINMGEQDRDAGAKLIHKETRRTEYESFSAWITACCNDPKLRELPRLTVSELARPDRPDEVIRHGRKDRIVDSFVRNVWSQRMRCFPCHTPYELDESNPKHIPAIKKHKEFIEKLGNDYKERMNIFRETPEATIDYLIQKSRDVPAGELPLVNLSVPRNSLLVLKPTSKLPQKNDKGEIEDPSSAMPVSHLGGLKMHVDDTSYKSFLGWIQDYARVVQDQYKVVAELPRDNWYPSKHVVMLREVPAPWSIGERVQIAVYAWNADKDAWRSEPVAFTQGQVTPVRNVVGSLFLLDSIGNANTEVLLDPENAKLQPGKYLIKTFIDSKQQLTDDPSAILGDAEFFGKIEIDAKWGEGFPNAERIQGSLLK